MRTTRTVLTVLLVFTFLLPLASFAASMSEPEELSRLINKASGSALVENNNNQGVPLITIK